MDNIRLQKISSLIKREISSIIADMSSNSKLIITTSKVVVTPDLSIAKIYFSVFPSNNKEKFISEVNLFKSNIRHSLAQKIKNQVRVIPELIFLIDDSLDYIENIENSIKNPYNPIK